MSMLYADYYAFTSGFVDFRKGNNEIQTQTYFFRKLPEKWGYVVTAGLGDVIDYLRNLKITDEEINWLKRTSGGDFDDDYHDYLEALKNYKFGGTLTAVPEGSIVFPNEPILTITERAPFIQIPEAFILSCMNTQSVAATISARIKSVIGKRSLLEFGARRHPNPLWLARGAYIGGADATSFMEAGYKYGIPYTGTMPHKFIMEKYNGTMSCSESERPYSESEKLAFNEYASIYPNNFLALVDTYNSVNGVINAIEVARNHKIIPKGVRLDSGDIYKLAHASRLLLNAGGFGQSKIYASGDLDEYSILELVKSGAPIDGFGVGTRYASVILGGVYKLCEVEGIPIMKMSDDIGKATIPQAKYIERTYIDNKMCGDLITDKFTYSCLHESYEKYILDDIVLDQTQEWVQKAREHCMSEMKRLPDGLKLISRNDFSPMYSVGVSDKLSKIRTEMLEKYWKEYTNAKEMERTIDVRRDEIVKKINAQLSGGLM